MKCPKCGYLGFETIDRCKNCGYDFSLAAPRPAEELPLRRTIDAPLAELTLQDEPVANEGGGDQPDEISAPLALLPDETTSAAAKEEELPLFSPPRAKPPLAVRKTSPEIPRTRSRTTRPLKPVTPPVLDLDALSAKALVPAPAAAAPVSPTTARQTASAGARVAAALVDMSILAGVDLAVLYFTLRIVDLPVTPTDAASLRPIPLGAFFALFGLGYHIGFTAASGQTIGKMLLGVRVIGDDGLGLDLAGAILRAAGGLIGAVSLGLLYLPFVLTGERRTLHDRLAGSRVVKA